MPSLLLCGYTLFVDSVGSRLWNPPALSQRLSAHSLTDTGDEKKVSLGWEEGLTIAYATLHPLTPHCSYAKYSVMTPFVILKWEKKNIVQSAFRHFRGNFKCKLLLLQTETKHAIPFITTFWLFPSISLSMLIRSHEREKALEKNISTRSFFRES